MSNLEVRIYYTCVVTTMIWSSYKWLHSDVTTKNKVRTKSIG